RPPHFRLRGQLSQSQIRKSFVLLPTAPLILRKGKQRPCLSQPLSGVLPTLSTPPPTPYPSSPHRFQWVGTPDVESLSRPRALGVAQAYMNQRKLDHEVKTLQVQAAQFAKQTGQWIGMVENFNQALKEIGDVENWARSIELDMRTIATALEYVYKGQLQSAPS
uniref:Biogenesis of lysosome-related organelles complex 1 subunit 1 n=1 Tax=Equus asinus TaxID=9793 RepID=A0A9L0JWM0_EQUAS